MGVDPIEDPEEDTFGSLIRELFHKLQCAVGWHQWSNDPELGYATQPVYICDRCAKIKM